MGSIFFNEITLLLRNKALERKEILITRQLYTLCLEAHSLESEEPPLPDEELWDVRPSAPAEPTAAEQPRPCSKH